MTEIIIRHCGKSSNVAAMDAVRLFIFDRFARRSIEKSGEVAVRGHRFLVTEQDHPSRANSICSVIWEVKELGVTDGKA